MIKIQLAKKRAELLKGVKIKLKVNEGRNRFVFYEGVIQNTYPNIFTFLCFLYGEERTISFSYVDLMTKRIKIFPFEEKKEELLS